METKGCNCRLQTCPLEGKCKTTIIVYRITVEAAGTTKQYIGLTSNSFKERFTGHMASFTYRKHTHKTSTLSSHIWELEDEQTTDNQHWSILSLAPSYSRRVRICHLCLMEKTHIFLADPRSTLN